MEQDRYWINKQAHWLDIITRIYPDEEEMVPSSLPPVVPVPEHQVVYEPGLDIPVIMLTELFFVAFHIFTVGIDARCECESLPVGRPEG